MIKEHDALMEAIEHRMIRIESKLSALMQSLGFDTHGRPLEHYDDVQPISNAPRIPFPAYSNRRN